MASKKTIKGKCKNCGNKYESGFFHNGKPAICMEEQGYCCMPCALEDILKKLKRLDEIQRRRK